MAAVYLDSAGVHICSVGDSRVYMQRGGVLTRLTEDGDYMANAIYHQIGRTCTILAGTGLISGDKAVLYCVVTRIELPAIRRIIRQADQSAFVTISDVGEVIGNHMKQPPAKKDRLSGGT